MMTRPSAALFLRPFVIASMKARNSWPDSNVFGMSPECAPKCWLRFCRGFGKSMAPSAHSTHFAKVDVVSSNLIARSNFLSFKPAPAGFFVFRPGLDFPDLYPA